MLEHQKLILQQVSNDPELFRKEVLKSISWLPSYEIIKLHTWLRQNYYASYKELISDIFEFHAA
ncbi:MAG: hypothetical protein GVY19_06320 [Bacteroidetes bacterium]|jgi:hypothetical protein|nr:hypothetical protein [Bacteroidota bacterium]